MRLAALVIVVLLVVGCNSESAVQEPSGAEDSQEPRREEATDVTAEPTMEETTTANMEETTMDPSIPPSEGGMSQEEYMESQGQYQDDPDLSEADEQGLAYTDCLFQQAVSDVPPEEVEAWGDEIADEVIETGKDIATILEERGYEC